MPIVDVDAFADVKAEPKYPVASMPPESPNCIIGKLVPSVSTSANNTVIFLTQLGMLVMSTVVPDVVAVSEVSVSVPPAKPVIVGLDSVGLVSVGLALSALVAIAVSIAENSVEKSVVSIVSPVLSVNVFE